MRDVNDQECYRKKGVHAIKPGRDFSTKRVRCTDLFSRESLVFAIFIFLFPLLMSSLIFSLFLLLRGPRRFLLVRVQLFYGKPCETGTERMKVTFVNYTSRILREKKNKHVLHESRDKIPFLSIFLSRYILIPKRLFYDKVTL